MKHEPVIHELDGELSYSCTCGFLAPDFDRMERHVWLYDRTYASEPRRSRHTLPSVPPATRTMRLLGRG